MLTKFTIIRKLFVLSLIVAFTGTSYGQGISFTVVTAPCHNDGILKAYFTGVTPPLTVVWTTEGTSGVPITHTGVTGLYDILTSYSGGPLTITATDSTGASETGSYSGYPPFTYYLAEKPALCPAVDTLYDTVRGGHYPYSIQWYNTNTLGIVATGDTAKLLPGSYGIIITDAAGCVYGSQYDPYHINAYSLPSFTSVISNTTANCTNGTASVANFGGIQPFSYQWSNGATTPALTNLVTGTYTVNVTDSEGCSRQLSTYVPQSESITVPVIPTAASCLDTNGKIIAYGSGGIGPYTYTWSNGAITQSQTGICGGYYSVQVTDANGCIGFGSGTVGITSPISYTYSASPSLCLTANGNATVVPSGGTGPYNVYWATTPAQVGVTATHLSAGDYYFTITDATGCQHSGTAHVPQVDSIRLNFSSVAAICSLSDGSMTVYPVGGVAPYTYVWSTGATTQSISGMPTGNYEVTVTDNLGCKATSSPLLDYYSPLTVGVVSTDASCMFTHDGVNTATPYGGTPPYTYSWSSGGNTSTINALPAGPYWVRVTDASGCTSGWAYSYVNYDTTATSCFCTIEGTVYADTNGDCTQDAGETGIANIQVYVSGMGYTYTDAKGHYSYKVPAGTYTVSENAPSYYPLSACQSNSVTVVTSTGAGCMHTVNFANQADTVYDVHISTWDYSAHNPVPGKQYTQTIIISNDGTLPDTSILAVYNPDGQLLAPCCNTPNSFQGTPYNYSTTANGVPTLNPGGSEQYFMTYNTPTNIAAGTSVVFNDTVAYNSPILFWLFDNTRANNINKFTTTVASSSTADFAEVLPQGTGSVGLISYTDSVLEYMVHFENTGTWPVENVTVIDTLDDNLNWTTLKPQFYSAPCNITLQQSGVRKVATFTFNDINLPAASSNTLGSDGMFTFTIHIKPGLASGTQFTNKATVYFDFNAPVTTNSTLNTLGTVAAGVTNVSTADNYTSFTIYPNPTSGSFNAVINSDADVAANMIVTDITGKTLISKTVALQKGTQTITTDASQLSPGMYLVTFNFAGKMQTQKLVIMK